MLLNKILFFLLGISLIQCKAFAQSDLKSTTVKNLNLIRVARIQSFLKATKNRNDIFDSEIRSPKSVLFSSNGRKLYINSLEGFQTVVYSWPSLEKLKTIDHIFTKNNQFLFQQGEETVFGYPFYQKVANKNIFKGKPVEMTLSHQGKYLWVPYYRRDWDSYAQSPSAIAVIDTRTDEIVRVMPTGPLPKFVSVSPDGNMLAVTHWGDNTIGIIDISSPIPSEFKYTEHLVVGSQLSMENMYGKNRDSHCGYCLRGTAFTPDSRYLIVARMGGGGLAAFDLEQKKYLGTILAIKPTPRHLIVTESGKDLIVSSNQSGYVTVFNLERLIQDFSQADGKNIQGHRGREVFVGVGARTIEVDSQNHILYAAVNNNIKLVAVDLDNLKIISKVNIDPYPVGLAISPDGEYVVLTSQGRSGNGGGNSVNIVKVNHE